MERKVTGEKKGWEGNRGGSGMGKLTVVTFRVKAFDYLKRVTDSHAQNFTLIRATGRDRGLAKDGPKTGLFWGSLIFNVR